MTRAMATIGATIAAALALAAGGSLAAPAATAEAHYLRASNIYHFPAWNPNLQAYLPSNGPRWIRLKDGYYQHGAYFASTSHRTDPDLSQDRIGISNPGVYRWRVHRWWSSHSNQYMMKSRLSRGSWESVVMNELVPDGPHTHGDGWYEWGGRLARDGDIGITEPQE